MKRGLLRFPRLVCTYYYRQKTAVFLDMTGAMRPMVEENLWTMPETFGFEGAKDDFRAFRK